MLEDHLGASKYHEYELWQDTEILAGEAWREEIRRALEKCDLGLLLVTPPFLGSKFISSEELPEFVGDKAKKPCIPVMLTPIDLRIHDSKGLASKQIFGHRTTQGRRKSFHDCTANQKQRFVMELFAQIEQRLNKLFGVDKT